LNKKTIPPVDDERCQLMQIEIEERKMALQERTTANRKAEAEIEKLELENKMLKKRLESEN
jgi:FtsZ-binding cell division protein ZapB